MFSDLKLQDKPTGDWTLERLRQARFKGMNFFILGVQKRTWTLPIGTFGVQKIVNNEIDLKKLQPSKV